MDGGGAAALRGSVVEMGWRWDGDGEDVGRLEVGVFLRHEDEDDRWR